MKVNYFLNAKYLKLVRFKLLSLRSSFQIEDEFLDTSKP